MTPLSMVRIRSSFLKALIFYQLIVTSNAITTEKDLQNLSNVTKTGKVFSLFSVVQFQNLPCFAQVAQYNGTCYTSSECTNKGGVSGGNCAAGFGVCCIFKINKAGTVNQNNTYIQNPGFPTAYGSTAGVSYTVNKVSPDVCNLRLDFNTFIIAGPQSGTVTIQSEFSPLCPDYFSVTVTTGQNIPKICGINSGQHIYVDIGSLPTDMATLGFSFSTLTNITTARQWEINVMQIPCASQTSPPNGCLQYFYGQSGRITTFNFADPVGGHLDNQQYSICIRPEFGYCCIKYQVCQDQLKPFSLSSGDMANNKANIDSCNFIDYVGIDGSSSVCSALGISYYSRFCGAVLSTDATSTSPDNIQLCDCTAPFEVNIFTNAFSDKTTSSIATPTANDAFSRGTCLDFSQVPC